MSGGFACLNDEALGLIMPMFLRLAGDGRIEAVGPTLAKVLGDAEVIGRSFSDCFRLKSPHEGAVPQELAREAGQRIRLVAEAFPGQVMRGVAVPDAGGRGVLFNLSFGIAVADAVREHNLTNADFAPTDLAVELLYLLEAKSVVLGELRALNERLQGARETAEAEALTDVLTGLANRRGMERAMERIMAAARPFAVLQIDLDLFKHVNDTLGHAAGDLLLREVAAILKDNTRDDDVVARIGGDEFVLLLPGMTEPDRLRRLGARLLAASERPFFFEGRRCRISLSIGATTTTSSPHASASDLLEVADRALYSSKEAGRGRMTIIADGAGHEMPQAAPKALAAQPPLPR